MARIICLEETLPLYFNSFGGIHYLKDFSFFLDFSGFHTGSLSETYVCEISVTWKEIITLKVNWKNPRDWTQGALTILSNSHDCTFLKRIPYLMLVTQSNIIQSSGSVVTRLLLWFEKERTKWISYLPTFRVTTRIFSKIGCKESAIFWGHKSGSFNFGTPKF